MRGVEPIMFNQNVQRHSFGITSLNEKARATPSVAAREYLEKKAVQEHLELIDRRAEKAEKVYEAQKSISKITQRKLTESQIVGVMNKLGQEGKSVIFKEILFELFNKSLYLDDDFKIQKESNLRELINQYVDKKGGYAFLESAFKLTKSPLLKNIISVCENIVTTVTRRKLQEIREGNTDINSIRFEMNDDEIEELNYEKEKISIDELADLVRKKVLTVIQDERSRQQREEELYSDLEKQALEEGLSVEEVAQKVIVKATPIEESTIFNSLHRHSFKEILRESVASITGNGALDDDDDETEFDIDTSIEDIMEDEYEEPTIKDITEDGSDEDFNEEFDTNEKSEDINLDLVLAECITKYTLMEMAYTIKLEDYTAEDLRRLSHKLLN